MTPDHWSGEDNFVGTTKWHINIMAVMNEEGRQVAIKEGCFTNLEAELRDALNKQFGEDEVKKGFVRTYTHDILNHQDRTDTLTSRSLKKWRAKHKHSYNAGQMKTTTATYTLKPSPKPTLDWEEIAYTDGSMNPNNDPKKEARLGAAVYTAKDLGKHLIRFSVPGELHTINTAELAAIHKALRLHNNKPVTIMTDSQVSLYLIRRALYEPTSLRYKTHYNMLMEIRQDIIERVNKGLSTQLLKVKSHIGVPGNEMADHLANEARKLTNNAATYSIADYNRNNMYWLSHVLTTPDGMRKGRHVCNLADGLHEICRKEWSQGFMNTGAVYYTIWQDNDTLTNNEYSHELGTLTEAQAKTVLKYRTGTLWNRKLAARYDRTGKTSDRCPLCGCHDSGSHIAGGCMDKQMKRLTVARHNKLSTMILKAVQKGRMGNNLTIADVGKQKQKRMQLKGVRYTRVPRWMIPKTNNFLRKKLRPDGLLMRLNVKRRGDKVDRRQIKEAKKHPVYIVEVKVCSDTNHEAKIKQATRQHEQLLLELYRNKWKRTELVTLTIGASGTITHKTVEGLKKLGIEDNCQRDRLCKQLHNTAIKYLHIMVVERRKREAAMGVDSFGSRGGGEGRTLGLVMGNGGSSPIGAA
jgi:ribonuclease HI